MRPAVVGREAELEAAEGYLDVVANGLAAFVLEGEPGIGKTTVWREVVRRAEERGYRVLATRPSEAEAKLSFSGLADLLAGVDDLAGIPDPQRRSIEVALAREEGESDRLAVFAGFVSLLTTLAGDTPVVVAVDDVQWLDRPTAAALEFAARRVSKRPVGIVATVRILDEVRPETFDDALDEANVHRLRLGPLTLSALHHLIKARLGKSLSRPALVKIERASAGNPLVALEIARQVVERGEPALGEALPVPDHVEDLVRARVRGLPARTRRALLRAAALSRPTVELVDPNALALAEEAELVRVGGDGRVLFAHPLYASAVYDAAPAERKREVHRRLAEQVDDPEERARHLALAVSGPNEDVAAALSAAAAHARDRGASEAAAELEELALRLTPAEDVESIVTRSSSLGLHLFNIGHIERARQVSERAIEQAPTAELRSEPRRWLFYACFYENDLAAAYGHAEDGLADAGTPELRALWHGVLAGNVLDLEQAQVHALARLALLDPEAQPAAFSQALLAHVRNELFCHGIADADALAEGMRLQESVAGWSSALSAIPAVFAEFMDDLPLATARWESYADRRRLGGDEISAAHATGRLARVECWRGQGVRAAELAGDAVAALEPLGLGVWVAQALSAKAVVAAYRGALDDASEQALRVLAMSRPGSHPLPLAEALSALGLVELSSGDNAAADRHYTEADRVLSSTGMRERSWFRFHGDHIEAAVALGDLARAEELVAELEERARILPRPWTLAVSARCRGLLFAAQGALDAGIGKLDEALVHHERLEMPFELARTLLVKGEIHRRRREKRLAWEAVERALAIFEELGAPLWAERARSEVARVRVRRAPDELTETEQQIAELAARGRTNKEIAAELFMSPKTVEKRLASVYRKLGIHSRAELGARMAERKTAAKT